MALCIVCRQREGDIVCEQDRAGIAKRLAQLPGRYGRLELQLMPVQALGDGQPRSPGKKEPPLPVRAAALSLLAGGNEQVSGMLHPLVRRWTTRRTVMVSRVAVVDGVGTIVEEQQQITDYHRELVVEHDPASGKRCRCGRVHDTGWKPLEIPDDDQIGVLPPREWLDTTVRYWRAKLGDHVPSRTPGAIAHRGVDALGRPSGPVTVWPAELSRPHGNAKTARAGRLVAAAMFNLLSTQGGREVWSYLHATDWLRQQHLNRSLGLQNVVDVDDPLQEDIESRFGEPPRSLALAWDVKYLLTHLDAACDRGDELGIDTFAAELQALNAEILRALGEEPRQIWIGRCPARIADPAAPQGPKKPCGAGLWQEPEWAQVPCSRCHTTWDTRGPAGRTLAREIRKLWPVDRRRRYTAEDRAALVPPYCPSCKCRVIIEWREVTGVGERQRWWQPRSSRCEMGCANAGRVL